MLIKAIMALLKRCYWSIESIGSDILLTLEGYYFDKKLNIDTGYYNEKVTQGIYGDSNKYEPTSYFTIKKLIEYLKLNESDVFVDFGCGKGRVISCIAAQKIKKVIGIELDEKMVNIAKANVGNLKLKKTSIEILNIDANNFSPIEGTIFFIFNSFGKKTFKTVVNNIKDSLINSPRRIRIIYHNPLLKSILNISNWLELDGIIDASNYDIFVWRNKLS